MGDIERHESFGQLRVSKISGDIDLFESNIQGNGAVLIEISRAKIDRHLNHNWIHSTEDLIEVYLSPLQWAEAITVAMNTSGVPCTINRFNKKKMSPPPIKDARKLISKELSEDLDTRFEKVNEAHGKLEIILSKSGSIKKTELRSIFETLTEGLRHFESNANYTKKCFEESVERTVMDAKQQIHHHISCKIHELGLESFSQLSSIKMIELEGDSK